MSLIEMLVKFGADISDLEKKIDAAKKSLRSFKDIGMDLKKAGQSLSFAITLPIMGIVAASLKAASDADEGVKRTLAGMQSAVNQTFVNMGRAILPSIVAIFNALKPLLDLLNMFILAFARLPQPIQVVVVVLALLAAAVGPVLIIVGQLVLMYARFVPILIAATASKGAAATASVVLAGAEGTTTVATYGLATAVNFLLGPVGLLLAAIGALVAIYMLLNQQQGQSSSWNASQAAADKENLKGYTEMLNKKGVKYHLGSDNNPVIDYMPPGVKLASGGIVTRPTQALVGESGPEAIIPLGPSGTSMVGGNITIPITIQMGDREIMRVVKVIGPELMRSLSTKTGWNG